ncbi:glycosyltransferase family 4 protein [Aeoliella sp.]|uniref:glycosyltransferase family 4 protein n=1 Tax=Aeoliella sp. TaxID=2795800 RepID=UPI003CCC3307
MSQRILHVIQSLDRYTPADQLLALAPVLAAQQFEQSVLVLGHRGELAGGLAEMGIEPTCLGQRWTLDPGAAAQLTMHVRKANPNVVHAWDQPSRRYVSLATAGLRGCGLVASWNTVERARLRVDLPMFFPRSPDRWLVEGKWARDSLAQQIAEGVIAVVPPTATPATSTLQRAELMVEFGLPADALLVGTAAQLTASMGVKELIWAVDMVRVLHPNIRLLIAGDGPQRDHLEHFACTAAVPENVCFLGDTNRWNDIVPHLDVYWQGTEAAAASPTALLTAMSAGVPVVASDTAQHRDWITDGETGYLVGFDARSDRTRITDQLLVDRELRKTIGDAGRRRFEEHYSPATAAELVAGVYREACDQPSASGPLPQ